MSRPFLPILIAGALLSLAGPALAAPLPTPSFAYDAGAAPVVTYGPDRTVAPGVIARDVSFVSTTGHKVTGEIISGAEGGSRPGVLFVHWLGETKTTNHTEFEPDAIALARRGATSLLVDTMWSAPGWFNTVGKSADDDYRVTVDQVIDLRRSLDVLGAQPGVDPKRIAYVAHDFGAMMGAFVAGTDARPSYYVLMAGTATLQEWYLLGKKVPDGYNERIAALDMQAFLKRTKARGVLFQYSTHDHYIPADRAALFFEAAPPPKGVFWYDTDHALAAPEAFADRQAWLVEKLFGA